MGTLRIMLMTAAAVLTFNAPLRADDPAKLPYQDPEKIEKWYADKLAWNLATTVKDYDKVGKKDPKWDKEARLALELAAKMYGTARPGATLADIYPHVANAIKAGCDDPMILYLYERTVTPKEYPGPEEMLKRQLAAEKALEKSKYNPIRRAYTMCRAAETLRLRLLKIPSEENKKEANRLFELIIPTLGEIREEDQANPFALQLAYDTAIETVWSYKAMLKDSKAGFDKVDEQLAKYPKLASTLWKVRGQFNIIYGWEARGNGTAGTVTDDAGQKFHERLVAARQALEEAWKIDPTDPHTATLMLYVEKGDGGERADMEKWFDRAMKNNPTNATACFAKLDWLDPKWHGSEEEMLEFGKACRDSGTWREGITLVIASTYLRLASTMEAKEQDDFWKSKEVDEDIQKVFNECLKHEPDNIRAHMHYAIYLFKSGHQKESYEHFKLVARNKLVALNPWVPLKQIQSMYDAVTAAMGKKGEDGDNDGKKKE